MRTFYIVAKREAKEVKGAAKQKIARKTGNPQQAAEGSIDEAKGRLQKKTGEIKRDVMRK